MTPPTTTARHARAPLGELLALTRSDETFAELSDLRQALVAVGEPARAFSVAAIVNQSRRRPVVVAVPTQSDAERLGHDLAAFLGPGAVELFPAWETLPFERVSPSLETMGRRLRTMWRLHRGAGGPTAEVQPPRVLVAAVRALIQR